MNNIFKYYDIYDIESFKKYLSKLNVTEKVMEFTSRAFYLGGYYTPEELIDLSLSCNFLIDNPFTKIKRGTVIKENVKIKNGSVIDGNNVFLGRGTVLDGAKILGNNFETGNNCLITGAILIDSINIGNKNIINTITGLNDGQINIGSNNVVQSINFYNPGKQTIIIGNNNSLHNGLNLNCSFSKGTIRIGHNNSLGKDGGGVITTAYQYNKQWWGDVLIGNNVQTTRGAEILGFSIIGWPLKENEEKEIKKIIIDGPIENVVAFFNTQRQVTLEERQDGYNANLYGVVKTKMCCLSGTIKIRDNSRVQSSFLRNVNIPERSKVYFSMIDGQSTILNINLQDRAIEKINITDNIDWDKLPINNRTNGYRDKDADFFASTGQAILFNP